jgi:hypothetical protein
MTDTHIDEKALERVARAIAKADQNTSGKSLRRSSIDLWEHGPRELYMKFAEAAITALYAARAEAGFVEVPREQAFPLNDWLGVEGDFRQWGPWLKHNGGKRPKWVREDITREKPSDTVVYLTENGGSGWGRNWSPTWEEIAFYRLRSNHPHYKKLAAAMLAKAK